MSMSNFFDKSDLTRKDVDEIVSETLRNCNDGEIYFEWIVDTETNSVSPGNQLGKDVLTLLDIKG